MDVEKSFVSKILTAGELLPAIEAKVTPEFFEDPDMALVYQWILDHWQSYAKVPGQKALGATFPTFRAVRTDEPLEYYVDKLIEARSYSIMEEGVSVAAKLLQDKDVSEAQATLNEMMMALARETSPIKDIDLTETGDERIERYRSYRELEGGLRGLPSGFDFIDRVTLGFQAEQLITYVGLPKSGKSTTMLLNAMAVQDYGKRATIIGFEMSNEEQAARHDAFRAGVDWLSLMGGRLGPKDFKRLERALREASNKPSLILAADVSATTTIPGVMAKITEHQPDIVFIDGVYMMDTGIPELRADTPQGLTYITRNLKRLAQRAKIPIVITTQVLPSKFSKRTGITIDSIGYTSSFAQDSDLIIGVEDVENDPDMKRMRMVTGRNVRGGTTAYIRWDFSTGTFEELDEGAAADTGGTYAPDPV